MTMRRHAPVFALLLTLAGCGDSGGSGEAEAGDAGEAGDPGGDEATIVTEDLGGGVYETVIDATSEEAWTYFDFETRMAVTTADPKNDDGWDLAGLRFNIKTNGGTSGSGGAAVAILEGTSFEAVTAAPAGGFVEDAAEDAGVGGEMANVDPGYAFDNWFSYNPMNHTLAPAAGRVYVVRTPEGNHFKLVMEAYYDDAGTPGFLRFRWAALP